jgi:hypothetical protein
MQKKLIDFIVAVVSDIKLILLGKSPRTSLLGYAAALCAILVAYPEALAWLPSGLRHHVEPALPWLTLVFISLGFRFTKDENVTGGTIPASLEARDRVDFEKEVLLKEENHE